MVCNDLAIANLEPVLETRGSILGDLGQSGPNGCRVVRSNVRFESVYHAHFFERIESHLEKSVQLVS